MTNATIRAVGTAAGTAAGLALIFAPVPWLAPAVAVLGGILQLCENTTTNKQAIRQLGARCETLLLAVKDDNLERVPENIQETVDACTKLLVEIHGRMTAWLNNSKFRQFVLQSEILEDVKNCHDLLDAAINGFMLRSHIELHVWQDEYQRNRQEDHREVLEALANIKSNQELMNETVNAQRNEIKAIMAYMQGLMTEVEKGDRRHNDLQHSLYMIQDCRKLLLPVTELRAGEVRRIGSHPIGGSPAFDIWEGVYLDSEKCAVKVIRGIEVSEKTRDRFEREVLIWRDVYEQDKGEYILPFYGICHSDGPYPYMVSPWMKNGDALSYVRRNPRINRRRLVRRIAEGLRLLHTQNPPIAHSDIKAANILINDLGNPVLADFGLSKVMEDITGMPFTQSRGVSDSYRWFAPELCCAPGIISTKSDIFAYSMTVLEIMTSEHPFAHIKRTPEVLIRMQVGERPHRPTNPEVLERGLDDRLWNLLTRCWQQDPDVRPDIHEVLAELPQEAPRLFG